MKKTEKKQCVAVVIETANQELYQQFVTIFDSKESWTKIVRLSQCPHVSGYYIDHVLGHHPFGPGGRGQKKNRELLSFKYPTKMSVNTN